MDSCEEDFVRVCRRHNLVLEERGRQVDPHLVCPGPPRHRVRSWRVVDRRKCLALYEATEDRGATKVMDEETTVRKKPQAKSQTIERAKFQDGAKVALFIRLTKEPKRWGGDPFRIRWQQGPSAGKKGTIGGVTKTCPDEISAREAWKAAVRSAISQGWKQVPIGQGTRQLELKPIPAPKKRAA